MKHKIHYTKFALADLIMAHKYITLNVNKATADNSIADIRNAIPKLECFPERGLVLTLPTGTANYRYLLYKKHIIFYQIQNDIVQIHRILSQRQNYLQLFFPDNPNFV